LGGTDVVAELTCAEAASVGVAAMALAATDVAAVLGQLAATSVGVAAMALVGTDVVAGTRGADSR
jgi:hypothetical protein